MMLPTMNKKVLLPILAFFSVVVFSLVSVNAFAKPQPPAELEAVISQFNEVEEAFESDQWEEALSEMGEINSIFKRIMPTLKEHVKPYEISNFRDKFMALWDSLKFESEEDVDEKYIDLQLSYFRITDAYHYDVPPALRVINAYIDEAEEATEVGDFEDVESEMDEIREFFGKIDSQLKKQGVDMSEIEKFVILNLRVKHAANDKDKKKILSGLKEMKDLLKAF